MKETSWEFGSKQRKEISLLIENCVRNPSNGNRHEQAIVDFITEIEAAAYERGKESGERTFDVVWNDALATVEEKVKESHLIVYLPLRDEVLSLINELKKQP